MFNTIRVAFFLAVRQLFRNNLRSVLLITFVMTLIFLNLVAVSGILVGLVEGLSVAYREKFIGDLVISPLTNKKTITDTDQIVSTLENIPEIKGFAVRYTNPGSIESNYNKRDAGKRREITSGQIYGINPVSEKIVTGWNKDVVEGDFLEEGDTGKIVIGKNLLAKYAQVTADAEKALGEVALGDTVLVTIEGKVNEFKIKGVLGGKTDVTRGAFISDTDMKKILDKGDTRASSISVRTGAAGQEDIVKNILVANGFEENQQIQTYAEGEPSFVRDLKKVFSILGWVIGGIGIVVAAVVIFIIIYINAITKRKYIGIMKGIGIKPAVIELSYIMQSIFYGLLGSAFGAFITYFGLIPLFKKYPIDFPFSDGIMVAPYADTLTKFAVLMTATILAGYFPARSIVKQNTLNAILGR